jgi:hypothetical protein
LESSEPWDLPTFNIDQIVVPNETTRNPIEIEDERTDVEDEQTGIFDMKMALMNIVSSESAKGTVVINGVEQHFTYDAAPSPDGRGAKTFMFHSLFLFVLFYCIGIVVMVVCALSSTLCLGIV